MLTGQLHVTLPRLGLLWASPINAKAPQLSPQGWVVVPWAEHYQALFGHLEGLHDGFVAQLPTGFTCHAAENLLPLILVERDIPKEGVVAFDDELLVVAVAPASALCTR